MFDFRFDEFKPVPQATVRAYKKLGIDRLELMQKIDNSRNQFDHSHFGSFRKSIGNYLFYANYHSLFKHPFDLRFQDEAVATLDKMVVAFAAVGRKKLSSLVLNQPFTLATLAKATNCVSAHVAQSSQLDLDHNKKNLFQLFDSGIAAMSQSRLGERVGFRQINATLLVLALVSYTDLFPNESMIIDSEEKRRLAFTQVSESITKLSQHVALPQVRDDSKRMLRLSRELTSLAHRFKL